MRVIWPMKSCEKWDKSDIILGCAEKQLLIESYGEIKLKSQYFFPSITGYVLRVSIYTLHGDRHNN